MEAKFNTLLSKFLQKRENYDDLTRNNVEVLNSNLEVSINSIFDRFVKEIIGYSDSPAQNLNELRKNLRQTKFKGHLFEVFCKKYFMSMHKVDNIWSIKDCPIEILNSLSLGKRDYGIDLIMQQGSNFFQIQCKFKTPKKLPLSKSRNIDINQ